MTLNEKISDYITFPRTFENYRWYKPILVLIISLIIAGMFQIITLGIFYQILGVDFIKSIFGGGYELMNTPLGIFFTDLFIIAFIPSLYIASRIIKDRPFSSYSSSRGGWNFKLYFKALAIPVILYIIYNCIETIVFKPKGTSNISIAFIIVLLISIPLQSIAEEYAYRGLIMQTFGSWIKIPVLAIIIQALLFAFSHGYNGIGIFEMIFMGLIYGFFAWKTNGIEVSSALHTANNFSFGLFVMLGLQESTSSPELVHTLSTIVFLIILVAIMYYIGKKTDWFGEIPENSQDI